MDEKITYRFLNVNGDNFYETTLADPRHPALTDGTWLPVKSDEPVGDVGGVTVASIAPGLKASHYFWPGNLNTAVTGPSSGQPLAEYLEMDTAVLEAACHPNNGGHGSLTGNDPATGEPYEFDLTGDADQGTYCTKGGVIKLAVQDVGLETPLEYTFLANDGLITISGQNATIAPFAMGILAMSDMHSDDDQFPIKIADSDFDVKNQAIVFASRSGVDVSGSEDSTLCLNAIGQEVKLQGSTSDFGPQSPNCIPAANPAIELLKSGSLELGLDLIATPGDVITYSFTVTNTGNVILSDVTVTDPLVTVLGGPLATLAVGASDSTTFSGTYAITQADIDAGNVDNITLASSEAPGGDPLDPSDDVTDDDTHSEPIPAAPAIDLVKTAQTLTDTNLDIVVGGLGDVVTYGYTVTNTGNVTLTGVTVTDDNGTPGNLLDDISVTVSPTTLAPNAQTTGTATHTITAADITNGSFSNVGLGEGIPPSGPPVTDTDPETVNFVNLSLAKTSEVSQVTAVFTNSATVAADNGSPDSATQINGSVVVATDTTYTITVTNSGGAAASNVTLTDSVPNGATFISVTSTSGTCGESGGTVTCNLGTIAANGGSVTVILVVRTTTP